MNILPGMKSFLQPSKISPKLSIQQYICSFYFLLLSSIQFDFSNYIRRLYQIANVTLADDDVVAIFKIEDIRKISSIIDTYSPGVLLTHTMKHFVGTQFFHMPARFRNAADEIKKYYNYHKEETRAIACTKYVFKNMKLLVSKFYNDNSNNQFEYVEVWSLLFDLMRISFGGL